MVGEGLYPPVVGEGEPLGEGGRGQTAPEHTPAWEIKLDYNYTIVDTIQAIKSNKFRVKTNIKFRVKNTIHDKNKYIFTQ